MSDNSFKLEGIINDIWHAESLCRNIFYNLKNIDITDDDDDSDLFDCVWRTVISGDGYPPPGDLRERLSIYQNFIFELRRRLDSAVTCLSLDDVGSSIL